MQRKFFVFLFVSLLLFISCTNTKKQQESESQDDSGVLLNEGDASISSTGDRRFVSDMVTAFIKAYNDQDNEKINSYIHPEAGLMVIHRPGALDWFEKVSKIDFDKPVPSYYPYASAGNNYQISYEIAPRYDCSTEKWNKTGLFVDLTTQTNFLGPIAANLKEYDDVELDPNYIKQIEMAEKNSYRVVVTTEVPLIFHVKQFDNGWYVTILDRGYADCGA
ncbi:hypothetical protein M8998_10955 [Sphingobacterium sp. lm-10]|uniref:hypothetical protein n=1 Tax=Sphingobacterium sp. lm-10 TaxID=2944904 RepID=UPI002021BCFD|nr:hypothetical protein [Sphingobacterium sp. lm-10]MCL7988459.1 hypothetical protein [Sphingobacterium sp. lm-10]